MEAAWTPAEQSAPAFTLLYNECCKGGYFTKKKYTHVNCDVVKIYIKKKTNQKDQDGLWNTDDSLISIFQFDYFPQLSHSSAVMYNWSHGVIDRIP